MKLKKYSVKTGENMIDIEVASFSKKDARTFKKLFDLWVKLNNGLSVYGRKVNIPEVLSEGMFCIFSSSVRYQRKLKGKGSASFDTINLKTGDREQIKASSIESDLTSFGPTSEWDKLYFMSFYNNGKKVINIEFKAHNPKQESINKDIEKLVRENCNGAWIQVFKTEDSGTVKKLFKKFESAFKEFSNSKMPISFHILILETKTLLSRKGKEDEKNYSKNIFNIEYKLWDELKSKPGKYQFYKGNNLTTEEHPNEDWQIDIFDI
jgi:hypothetical protein